MASGPRVRGALPSSYARPSSGGDGYSLPPVSYTVGRPVPKPVFNLAALFGGSTFGPRNTAPWQAGPKQAVVGGANVYGASSIDVFLEGGHAWRSGPGFPQGDAWPGWPESWDTPYFTKGESPHSSRLTARISTVWSCVDLISRLLSTMPLGLSRESIPQENLPPWLDNPEPLLYSSIVDAIKCVVNSMLTKSEAFILPSAYYADGVTVARWFVLNPDVVVIKAQANGTNRLWIKTGPHEDDKIEITDEVLHLKYQTLPGEPHGIGPLEAAWRNIASAESMADYASSMSGRGGVPNAVLQSETSLTDEQAGKLKNSWRKMIASNGAEPVILTKGLTYTALSMNAKELALLDNRVFDEQRIAAAFGVPSYLAGLPSADSMTYSSVAMIFDLLWRQTLRPLSRAISLGLSLKFLPNKVYLTFDADELTRPGLLERSQAYGFLIDKGILTPDEIRIEEGYAPLGGESAKPKSTAIPPALAQNAGLAASNGSNGNQPPNQSNGNQVSSNGASAGSGGSGGR